MMTAAFINPLSVGSLWRSKTLQILLSSGYSPRRALYLAHPWLLWTNVLSDVLTTLAYAVFFCGLCYFGSRLKKIPELKSSIWVFVAFGIFILSSGATVLIRVVTIWVPLYQFSVIFKVLCAAAAMPAAILFAWQARTITSNVARFFQLLASEQRSSEALRKSEEFLDRTGRIAGVGGWEVDLVNSEVTWSAETYRIHGVSPEYKPTLLEGLAFYTADCRPIITAAVEAACTTGTAWDLELSVTRVDGTEIWVRTVGAAEFRDGIAIRLAGAFQDISARVAERTALREANERVALATDSGGIGIWDWNIVKGVVNCDSWMHRLHGKEPAGASAGELLWRDHVHPEDRDRVIQAMHDAIAGTKAYDTEFRVVWPDGSIHNLRATAQVTRDSAGRALRMVGANWDVTEARHLTEELAQHHELLRVTLQSIGDGVITTDAECNVVWLNPVAERLTGWTATEAVGQPLINIFNIAHADTGLPVENPVVACLSHGSIADLAPDTNLISRDGCHFGIEDSAAPILGSRDELLGAVLVFHDVTEQRRLLAEARRATQAELKLKDDFLSHVSHELRSPLTSIYSFTSIIADDLAGATTPEQQEYLRIVLKNVTQLQAMIEDLLTVTQAKEGKLSVQLQSTCAYDAVVDAVHTIRSAAASKHICVATDIAATLPPAYADPTRLRQILIILLDNAVKFTPAGGGVSVRVYERDEHSLLLEVSDTGCGIPPDKRLRVFENLYQIAGDSELHLSETGRNGLGLGLHIARNLVTRQGGNIWIAGAPDQGSIFSFTLPIFNADRMKAPADEAPLRGLAV